MASGVGERGRHRRLRLRRWFTLPVLVTVAVPVAVYAIPHWSTVKTSLRRIDRQLESQSTHVQTPALPGDPHSLRLQWHAGLTSPAKRAALWWINTPDGKRVRVRVAAGTTPLAALKRALARQGWHAVYP